MSDALAHLVGQDLRRTRARGEVLKRHLSEPDVEESFSEFLSKSGVSALVRLARIKFSSCPAAVEIYRFRLSVAHETAALKTAISDVTRSESRCRMRSSRVHVMYRKFGALKVASPSRSMRPQKLNRAQLLMRRMQPEDLF